jgi:hypothetical protein
VSVIIVVGAAAFAVAQLRSAAGPVSRDRSAADLVEPPVPAHNGGQWAFLQKDDQGRPVAYDPCRTIRYVVHVGSGPVNGVALVQEGVARLEKATGLRFRYEGTTDRIPAFEEQRGADEPVWIGWATPNDSDQWTSYGDVLGHAGSSRVVRPDGTTVYVTGVVALRPTSNIAAGFAYGPSSGGVLLHELGHLVGLDHVADERQIMHAGAAQTTPADYGPGDLAGLYELGSSRGCH